MKSTQAVLFDLDGTLLDTAPDLALALNHIRHEENLPPLTIESYRPIISQGAKGLINHALGIEESHTNYARMREQFLNYYQQHIADASILFPRMEAVLMHINKLNMPWGIVTNKYTQYTRALLTALPLPYEPQCLVCGDTLSTSKPSPDPLLLAARQLKKPPEN